MTDKLVHSLPSPSPAKRVFLGLLALLVFVGVFSFIFIFLPLKKLKASGEVLKVSVQGMMIQLKSQDLIAAQKQLQTVKADLSATRDDLYKFKWLNLVPFANKYYQDGQHAFNAADEIIAAGDITIEAVAPYADLIGFKGLSSGGDGAKTAQDRITIIINTLDKIGPQLTSVGERLEKASSEISSIDPKRYPEEAAGIKVRSQLETGKNLLRQVSGLITDARPLLESAPYILGANSPRKYLVLFQNDAELRPTGGFLTGYAVISISKGKISTVLSDDIYKLDEKFPKRIPAPAAILKYHPKVPYWYLRDQNLSPDFKVSMDTFMPNYKLTKEPAVDGVIAVDTQLLVDLLGVTGEIGVSGYGNFSAKEDPRCNCPNVFYELQLLAGGEEAVIWDSVSGKIIQAPANYGQRKAFLGPLMYSVLANVMAQPKSKMAELVNTVLTSIQEKHVQMYFMDSRIQSAIEGFNLAGRVTETTGDYLMVVDTNFSGAKTNIWVTYKADQKIEIASDGSVVKTLTLTYSNPQVKAVKITGARNLNGMFRDWLRVYVPKGSELIEAKGYELGQAVGEDLGKTVFEGFFTLAPGNTKIISLKYKLPIKLKSPYQILVQKQGGTKNFPYTISINNKKHPEVILDGDKELSFSY